ncbi:MAG TPA: hypothetical protein VJX70_00725 [Candidatus Acidoferrum sp.]|nr:hypothetical protein [Candidatus Acidoferrum sp.]
MSYRLSTRVGTLNSGVLSFAAVNAGGLFPKETHATPIWDEVGENAASL